jgi:hypothetical protein
MMIFFKTGLIIFNLLLFTNIASAKDKEIPFIRDGVSFSIPGDWKFIANDSIGDNAYYFSAERTGKLATGLITVTWVNEVKKTEEIIFNHQQSMRSASIFRNPGIEFTLSEPDNFAGLKGQSCLYTALVKEQKLDGIIHCFNAVGKTVTIFFQSGSDDSKINAKAFELVRQTFNCRE